jgi:hypothetical protein
VGFQAAIVRVLLKASMTRGRLVQAKICDLSTPLAVAFALDTVMSSAAMIEAPVILGEGSPGSCVAPALCFELPILARILNEWQWTKLRSA